MKRDNRTIAEIFDDGRTIQAAVRRAVREALGKSSPNRRKPTKTKGKAPAKPASKAKSARPATSRKRRAA